MISSIQPIPDGLDGIAQIVQLLADLKSYYGRLPAIRAAALQITASRADHDQEAQVNKLASFVRGGIVYRADPLNAEFITTPDRLLLDIHANGFTYGDCDDHALCFASLAESIGIPCDIAGVRSPGAVTPDHVIVIAYLDGGALDFDLVAKGVEQPAYEYAVMPR